MARIYFDNHATTPVDPRVMEAMLPYFTERFGNASSKTHSFGWEARRAVDEAREKAASLIGARPREIVFTSGATESDNLAIRGAALYPGVKRDHVVTVATEHPAVLDTCRALEKQGIGAHYLPVGGDGLVRMDQLKDALTDRTLLVSVMHGNNEIGVLQPMAEIGKLARERGVLFHCDAAQGAGREPIDVNSMCIDLLSLSAHKMYGPKGVGALYVRSKEPRVKLAPILEGGGHEKRLRSGTLNVPGIVGLGRACDICRGEMDSERERIRGLRDRLEKGLKERLDQVELNGHPEKRLAGNLSMSFARAEAEAVLMGLKDIALSSGSACSSDKPEPSHVLRALGIGDDRVHTAVRFGLGRFNTAEEVDVVVEKVAGQVERLRARSGRQGRP